MDTNENRIAEPIAEGERSAKQMPIPSGYHILLALPKVEAKYDSGIIKSDQTKQQEEVSSVVGFVVAMGSDCYQDKVKFPTGPWCKKGDFVVVGAYFGQRIKVHGQELRLINDDQVLAVTEDPRGYSRI